MFLGTYTFTDVTDTWKKNESKTVWLHKANGAGAPVPLYDEGGGRKEVAVQNLFTTLVPDDDYEKWCLIVKIGDSYWLAGGEC